MLTDLQGFVPSDEQRRGIETIESVLGRGDVLHASHESCDISFDCAGWLGVVAVNVSATGLDDLYFIRRTHLSPLKNTMFLEWFTTADDLKAALRLCGHEVG